MKLLLIGVTILLCLQPQKLRASELPPIPYDQQTIRKPSQEIIQKLTDDYARAQIELARQRTSNGGYWARQCVSYGKEITGHYGTWGNGGRYLSLNTSPVIGAVIIFRYVHVGVITGFDGYNITFTDRNYDLRGGIRLSVQTTINDPTIKGYHLF